MGNRGCLHGPDRRLGTARWRSKLWICCTLVWKDWRRDPMPPGRWTALFFLDEATALAAGHRPCAYCRRKDFLAYAGAWQRAGNLPDRPRAAEMDARLHAERVVSHTRRQVTRPAAVRSLPDGVFIRYRETTGLLVAGRLLAWSFAGYGAAVSVPPGATIELLTPPASVAALTAGYRPLLHPSAQVGDPTRP
jgi:hypothetical protein